MNAADKKALNAFMKHMKENVIPRIVKTENKITRLSHKARQWILN